MISKMEFDKGIKKYIDEDFSVKHPDSVIAYLDQIPYDLSSYILQNWVSEEIILNVRKATSKVTSGRLDQYKGKVVYSNYSYTEDRVNDLVRMYFHNEKIMTKFILEVT